MKIDGLYTKTERVTLDVKPWDAFNRLQTVAYKAAGIDSPAPYLSKDGTKIMVEDEHPAGAGHTWYDERVLVETPSQVQFDVIERFNALRQTLAQLDLGA